MDTVAYHPLPDLFLSDGQSFPDRDFQNILLFKIVSVNDLPADGVANGLTAVRV
jgi:hypothetical protein